MVKQQRAATVAGVSGLIIGAVSYGLNTYISDMIVASVALGLFVFGFAFLGMRPQGIFK